MVQVSKGLYKSCVSYGTDWGGGVVDFMDSARRKYCFFRKNQARMSSNGLFVASFAFWRNHAYQRVRIGTSEGGIYFLISGGRNSPKGYKLFVSPKNVRSGERRCESPKG